MGMPKIQQDIIHGELPRVKKGFGDDSVIMAEIIDSTIKFLFLFKWKESTRLQRKIGYWRVAHCSRLLIINETHFYLGVLLIITTTTGLNILYLILMPTCK